MRRLGVAPCTRPVLLGTSPAYRVCREVSIHPRLLSPDADPANTLSPCRGTHLIRQEPEFLQEVLHQLQLVFHCVLLHLRPQSRGLLPHVLLWLKESPGHHISKSRMEHREGSSTRQVPAIWERVVRRQMP